MDTTTNTNNTTSKHKKCSNIGCSKKLTLTDLICRCGNTFCSTHRLPETHDCTHDYKLYGRCLLNKQNQQCVADKIIKI
jgi:predicted nucleic acid binding AN1-type Zn finger protein